MDACETGGGAAVRRPRFGHRAGARARAGLRLPRAVGRLRAASRCGAERRGRVAARWGRREHRVMRVDLAGIGGSALTDRADRRAGAADAPAFRSPTCRRATPSCWRSRSPGRKCSARATCSSASTCSTRAAIRTAGRSSSPPSRRWRALATKAGVEGHPAASTRRSSAWTKAQIIRAGLRARGRLRAMTVSCYQADRAGRACGRCDCLPAARARLRGRGCRRPDRAIRRAPTVGVARPG